MMSSRLAKTAALLLCCAHAQDETALLQTSIPEVTVEGKETYDFAERPSRAAFANMEAAQQEEAELAKEMEEYQQAQQGAEARVLVEESDSRPSLGKNEEEAAHYQGEQYAAHRRRVAWPPQTQGKAGVPDANTIYPGHIGRINTPRIADIVPGRSQCGFDAFNWGAVIGGIAMDDPMRQVESTQAELNAWGIGTEKYDRMLKQLGWKPIFRYKADSPKGNLKCQSPYHDMHTAFPIPEHNMHGEHGGFEPNHGAATERRVPLPWWVTDFRGAWKEVSDISDWRKGAAIMDLNNNFWSNEEIIEQCGDRVVISTHKGVRDFVHADGSIENGVHDWSPNEMPKCAEYFAGGLFDAAGCFQVLPENQAEPRETRCLMDDAHWGKKSKMEVHVEGSWRTRKYYLVPGSRGNLDADLVAGASSAEESWQRSQTKKREEAEALAANPMSAGGLVPNDLPSDWKKDVEGNPAPYPTAAWNKMKGWLNTGEAPANDKEALQYVNSNAPGLIPAVAIGAAASLATR